MCKDTDFIDALWEWEQVFFHRSMHEFIHSAKKKSLSMSQLGALFHLRKSGSCGVSDIGEDLGVTNAAASQMLDKLVHHGFISRARDPRDRRAKQIVLTQSGHAAIEDVLGARKRWFEALPVVMTPEELEIVTRGVRILTEKTLKLEKHTR